MSSIITILYQYSDYEAYEKTILFHIKDEYTNEQLRYICKAVHDRLKRSWSALQDVCKELSGLEKFPFESLYALDMYVEDMKIVTEHELLKEIRQHEPELVNFVKLGLTEQDVYDMALDRVQLPHGIDLDPNKYNSSNASILWERANDYDGFDEIIDK